jgi:hypothetical protein
MPGGRGIRLPDDGASFCQAPECLQRSCEVLSLSATKSAVTETGRELAVPWPRWARVVSLVTPERQGPHPPRSCSNAA